MTWACTPTTPCAALLKKNELNNLVYMFLRYGLYFNGCWRPEVENEDILAIVKEVGGAPSKTKLIDTTLAFAETKHGPLPARYAWQDTRAILQLIYEEFLQLPFSLRNDLGQDTAYFEQKELN